MKSLILNRKNVLIIVASVVLVAAIVLGLLLFMPRTSDASTSLPPVLGERKVTIADFETTTEITRNGYINSFGSFSLNEGNTYVTKGKASLQLNVVGDALKQLQSYVPTFNIYTNNFDQFNNDFSDVIKLGLDLYNNSGKDTTVKISVVFSNGATPEKEYVLKDKQWNNLDIQWYRDYIHLMYSLNDVRYIQVKFEKPVKVEDRLTIYADNLTAHLTSKDIVEPVIRETDEVIAVKPETTVFWKNSFTSKVGITEDPQFLRGDSKYSYVFYDDATLTDTDEASWPTMLLNLKSGKGVDISKAYSMFIWAYNDTDDDQDVYTQVGIKLGTLYKKGWSKIEIPIDNPLPKSEWDKDENRNKYLESMNDSGEYYDTTDFRKFNLTLVNKPVKPMYIYIDSIKIRESDNEPVLTRTLPRNIGNSVTLTAKTEPSNCELTYKVLDPDLNEVKIENGVVNTEKIGTYIVYCYAKDVDGNETMAKWEMHNFGQSTDSGNIDHCDNPENLIFYQDNTDGVNSSTLSFNTNKNFIKAGTGSYKMSANNTTDTAWPMYRMMTLAINDFTKYTGMTFWVYNNGNETVPLYLQKSYVHMEKVADLAPKQWKQVTITVDQLKAFTIARTDEYKDKPPLILTDVHDIAFSTETKQQPLELYFDEFRLYVTAEKTGNVLESFADANSTLNVYSNATTTTITYNTDKTYTNDAIGGSVHLVGKKYIDVTIKNLPIKPLKNGVEFTAYNNTDTDVEVFLARDGHTSSYLGIADAKSWTKFFVDLKQFTSLKQLYGGFDPYDLAKLDKISFIFSPTVMAENLDIYMDAVQTFTTKVINKPAVVGSGTLVNGHLLLDDAENPSSLTNYKASQGGVNTAKFEKYSSESSNSTQFVHSGTTSYRLTNAVYTDKAWPGFFIKQFAVSDFSKFTGFTFWAYNNSAEDVPLYVSKPNIGEIKIASLTKGKWTKVSVTSKDLATLNTKNPDYPNSPILNIKDVSYLKFFVVTDKFTADIYFDDFALYQLEAKSGNEMESFKEPLSLINVTAGLSETQYVYPANTTYVKDNIGGALKVIPHNALSATVTVKNLPITNITSKAGFCFWVYNENDNPMKVFLAKDSFQNKFIGYADPHNWTQFFVSKENLKLAVGFDMGYANYDAAHLTELSLLFANEDDTPITDAIYLDAMQYENTAVTPAENRPSVDANDPLLQFNCDGSINLMRYFAVSSDLTKSVNTDAAYAETGSQSYEFKTSYSDTTGQKNPKFTIRRFAINDLSSHFGMTMWVYNKGTTTVNLYTNKANVNVYPLLAELKPGTWTKVVIPNSKLVDDCQFDITNLNNVGFIAQTDNANVDLIVDDIRVVDHVRTGNQIETFEQSQEPLLNIVPKDGTPSIGLDRVHFANGFYGMSVSGSSGSSFRLTNLPILNIKNGLTPKAGISFYVWNTTEAGTSNIQYIFLAKSGIGNRLLGVVNPQCSSKIFIRLSDLEAWGYDTTNLSEIEILVAGNGASTISTTFDDFMYYDTTNRTGDQIDSFDQSSEETALTNVYSRDKSATLTQDSMVKKSGSSSLKLSGTADLKLNLANLPVNDMTQKGGIRFSVYNPGSSEFQIWLRKPYCGSNNPYFIAQPNQWNTFYISNETLAAIYSAWQYPSYDLTKMSLENLEFDFINPYGVTTPFTLYMDDIVYINLPSTNSIDMNTESAFNAMNTTGNIVFAGENGVTLEGVSSEGTFDLTFPANTTSIHYSYWKGTGTSICLLLKGQGGKSDVKVLENVPDTGGSWKQDGEITAAQLNRAGYDLSQPFTVRFITQNQTPWASGGFFNNFSVTAYDKGDKFIEKSANSQTFTSQAEFDANVKVFTGAVSFLEANSALFFNGNGTTGTFELDFPANTHSITLKYFRNGAVNNTSIRIGHDNASLKSIVNSGNDANWVTTVITAAQLQAAGYDLSAPIRVRFTVTNTSYGNNFFERFDTLYYVDSVN